MPADTIQKRMTAIAPSSRLIRIIGTLCYCEDSRAIPRFRQITQKYHLPYEPASLTGRLEFALDLILHSAETLSSAEKKALDLLFLDGEKRLSSSSDPLLSFSMDCLRQMLASDTSSCPPSFLRTRKRLPAGAVLMALSFSGFFSGSCTQEQGPALPESPPSVYAAVSGAAADPLEMLRPDSHSLNKCESPGLSTGSPQTSRQDRLYTVQKGDSVRNIAVRFHLDYKEVVRQNNIRYDRKRDWFVLHPGQKLLLPGIRAAAAPSDRARKSGFYLRGMFEEPEPFRYHLIKKGESLWTISRVYCISMHKIISLNGITDPDRIVCGNLLKLPSKKEATGKPFSAMTLKEKIRFLKARTIPEGHPYISTLVEVAEQFKVDPRLYASLIWEESWFNPEARSRDNCRRLAQLDPRFHKISDNVRANFEKSLRYLSHEFSYYRTRGFDSRSAIICSIAAYNGGNTRIRRFIRTGLWDGRNIDTIPLRETREHIRKVFKRCRNNYHAVL